MIFPSAIVRSISLSCVISILLPIFPAVGAEEKSSNTNNQISPADHLSPRLAALRNENSSFEILFGPVNNKGWAVNFKLISQRLKELNLTEQERQQVLGEVVTYVTIQMKTGQFGNLPHIKNLLKVLGVSDFSIDAETVKQLRTWGNRVPVEVILDYESRSQLTMGLASDGGAYAYVPKAEGGGASKRIYLPPELTMAEIGEHMNYQFNLYLIATNPFFKNHGSQEVFKEFLNWKNTLIKLYTSSPKNYKIFLSEKPAETPSLKGAVRNCKEALDSPKVKLMDLLLSE